MVYRQNTAPKINTALLHRAGEAPHFHQELEILYLMEGTLTVALDGKEYALQKDDVLVVNCSHTHALRGGGPGLTVLQVQVSYALLAEIAPGDVLYFHCNSAADAYHPYGEVRRLMRQLLLSYAGTRRCTEAVRYSYIYPEPYPGESAADRRQDQPADPDQSLCPWPDPRRTDGLCRRGGCAGPGYPPGHERVPL